MATFWEGGMPRVNTKTMKEFLTYEGNRDSDYRDFTQLYLFGNYEDFISQRKKDLNIKGISKYLYNIFPRGYSFSSDDSQWRNLKKVLEQVRSLDSVSNEDEFYTRENLFYLSKSKFNEIKLLWTEYIDYTEDFLIKTDPSYKLNKNINNF